MAVSKIIIIEDLRAGEKLERKNKTREKAKTTLPPMWMNDLERWWISCLNHVDSSQPERLPDLGFFPGESGTMAGQIDDGDGIVRCSW